MVNARMVNASPAYFSPATFCESIRVFALIPRFRNPFKYRRSFNLNHETVHFFRTHAWCDVFYAWNINDLLIR